MQIVVGGRVEIDQAPLPQLHHGDRGEGLGEGADPKDGVLRDRFLGVDIRDAVAEEPVERPATDDANSKTSGGPAVEHLGHLALQVALLDSSRRAARVPGLGFGGRGGHYGVLLSVTCTEVVEALLR